MRLIVDYHSLIGTYTLESLEYIWMYQNLEYQRFGWLRTFISQSDFDVHHSFPAF